MFLAAAPSKRGRCAMAIAGRVLCESTPVRHLSATPSKPIGDICTVMSVWCDIAVRTGARSLLTDALFILRVGATCFGTVCE